MRGRLITGGSAGFYTVEEAFAYCRRLAESHYENFTTVSWVLPREVRRHLYPIYAFCRGVDDLGDEADGDRIALLSEWETELRRCYSGDPQLPTFVALKETIARFSIPPEPFLRLIEANRIDQRTTRYESYADLLHYCEHSANPVGHLVLYVFGYPDEHRHTLADATCTALQLVNFWQDVSIDLQKGRVYIPLEDLAAFNYSVKELEAGVYNEPFRRLMAFEVQRTRGLFATGLALINTVKGRLKVALRLFTLGGLSVLDGIQKIEYDVLHKRPALSRQTKARLCIRGLLPIPIRTGRL